MLTGCYPRPPCAIKDNDEGILCCLAAGDDGDDDGVADAAITNDDEDLRSHSCSWAGVCLMDKSTDMHTQAARPRARRHIFLYLSGRAAAQNSKDIYADEPVAMPLGIATITLA